MAKKNQDYKNQEKNNIHINLQLSNLSKMINKVPGALIYKGNIVEPFKIEVMSYNEEKCEKIEFQSSDGLVEFKANESHDDSKIKWVNITGINNVDEIKKIGHLFNIDEFVLEEILDISKHSSYKITEDFLYSDLQMIYSIDHKIIYENIGLLLINNYILTFQEREGDVFDSIRDRLENKIGHIRSRDRGYSYFCFLDALIDNYIDALGHIEKRIEFMEELVTEVEPLEINSIHEVRKQLMVLKFSANPIEKLIQECKHKNYLGEENNVFLESLSNHTKEVINELLIQKELIDGIYENYILNNSNDMNKVMTTLTIFSAIFIPLSFLAGVFGMNFEYIPGLGNPNGYFYFLGGCAVTAIFMISFFKVKKWF